MVKKYPKHNSKQGWYRKKILILIQFNKIECKNIYNGLDNIKLN